MTHVINNVLIGLNNVGRVFCDYAAGVFVQSALLVILLLVIDLLLRKRVRAIFRYCLWMLVLVKLVLPPMLSLPTGIGYWVGDRLPAAFPISNQAFDVVGLERTSPSGEMPQVRPTRDIAENEPSIMLADSALTPLTWQAVLFILWLVGVFAFLVVLVQRIRFVRGLIAVSSPAKKELLGLLEQCRRKIGVRRDIRLRISDTIPSPAVCGFFRPTVLIPATLVEKLSPEGLRATLIHELAHIKRGDLWVNSVQTFLQVIYFYNPFVWFANAVIRRVCEEAVDETVLVTLGDQAKNYSNTLIDIGEMAFWRADLGLRLIGVTESKKALQWRIRHMLNRPIPKSSKLGALGIIVILIIAAVLLPMARAQKPGEDNKPVTAENEGKPAGSLVEAMLEGDIERLGSLIVEGADVNAEVFNQPLLHYAVARGDRAMVELLLSKGADVKARKQGKTALHVATAQVPSVTVLLVKQGKTALHVATAQDPSVAVLLVNAGADVNAKDNRGRTPLHKAAWQGRKDIADLLLTRGASTSAKNRQGRTPLHYAAEYGRTSLVELLLAKGAEIDARDNEGHTPLYLALHSFRFEDPKAVVQLLARRGGGVSAAHLAAYLGDLAKVKKAIRGGVSINSRDGAGFTLLHAAAKGGQTETIEFLLASGANINDKAEGDWTPLHCAAAVGNAEVTKLLIAKGADIDAKDDGGSTPLHASATYGRKYAAEVLIASGADLEMPNNYGMRPLHAAAWGFSPKTKAVVEVLIAKGADVNAKDKGFGTPLHYLVIANWKDVTELLIANGADVNAKGVDAYEPYTPLYWAVISGYTEMVALLVEKGADVNVQVYGETPLHAAVYLALKETAEILINKGADVNAKGKEGRTPLSIAKEEGYIGMVELLRKHGAKK